jgi:DNA-directed RNA polymerase I subunit RPA43
MTMKAMSEPASESSTAVVRDAILPFDKEEEEEDDDDDGVDMFERLGKMGDKAVAKRRAEEEAEIAGGEKKKKKKRNAVGEEGKVKSKSKREKHKRSKP